MLRVRGRGAEVHEAIGRIVGPLVQPVFPPAQRQIELVPELVIELAEQGDVLFAAWIFLFPQDGVGPGADDAISLAGGRKAGGGGGGNGETHHGVGIEDADRAAETVDGIKGQSGFRGELVLRVLAYPLIGLVRQTRNAVIARQNLLRAIGRIFAVAGGAIEIARR